MGDLHQNLENLRRNRYPGRGIIVGRDESGERIVQIYWIMGRSPSSRSRLFRADGGRLFTEPLDPAKVTDPLTVYTAMDESAGAYVVSNGDQTDDVMRVLSAVGPIHALIEGLAHREYEPDKPNWTPRITALCSITGRNAFEMSILRKSAWGDLCERHFFTYESLHPGIGKCLTTYMGDGAPLPAFDGVPYELPIAMPIHRLADFYWDALDEGNRVALALKVIDVASGSSTITIRNKYEKA